MKIAVLDDYAGAALELADWSGLGEVTVFRDTLRDLHALAARLAPFEVICAMRERTPLGADLIALLPNLRLIVSTGPRNAAIDLAAARERGICVCGTEGRKTTTSELAMLMILALNRRLQPEAAALRSGGWQEGLGRDLAGLTLGLIGLGNIGGQMATLGKAFGMEVLAWSQNLSAARAAEVGVERMESLPALMARADVSSVHLVLSERSRGLIGAEAFGAAKQGHVFVNTSRGPIVDSNALLAGLRAGRPAMAGIDVFDVEPLPADDPMRDRALIEGGRLLLTPHLGYSTEATFRLYYRQTVEAIRAWQSDDPIRVMA
ncbi:D-2-hydroxyacid dehydrogenase family protein [Sulfitobacter sp. LCG007]